ncbi:MAG: hypothetical protein SFY81_14205 [Verrucomicrobiota bacterium]|nr:hypothetical protein [Verrucomicrobiota bacterium]
MDVIFACSNCRQQLEADASLAGNTINCPSCNSAIVIPEPDPANLRTSHAATNAATKEEKHFQVPVSDGPTATLIKKPNPPLEAAAKNSSEKQVRIKTIKHTECVEVGHDRFDEVVSNFLGKIGEQNIVNISTIAYSHIDLGSRQMLTDYGVMIVYKG